MKFVSVMVGVVNQTDLHNEIRQFLSDGQIIQRTKDCSKYFDILQPTHFLYGDYKNDRMFAKDPSDPESMYRSNFSIAFAHLVHNEPGIFELFMLLYFRPYNSHCLHIDPKVQKEHKKTLVPQRCRRLLLLQQHHFSHLTS